jgi:hypothetical protein
MIQQNEREEAAKQEPNTGVVEDFDAELQEPNTRTIQEPNTGQRLTDEEDQ